MYVCVCVCVCVAVCCFVYVAVFVCVRSPVRVFFFSLCPVVFPSWLYLVVYLIVVCIACYFTIACFSFDVYFSMSGVQHIYTHHSM
jgi:hypothetical protein